MSFNFPLSRGAPGGLGLGEPLRIPIFSFHGALASAPSFNHPSMMYLLSKRRGLRAGSASLGCAIQASLLLFLLNSSAHCEDVVSPITAAIAVAETIESPHLRFEEMAELATTVYSEAEKQRGIKLLDQLRVQTGDVAGASERKKCMEAVAVGYIEIGEIDTAVDIHQQLGMTDDRIRLLLWWASRIRYSKKFDESDRLLLHMAKAVREVEIDQPSEREQFLASSSAVFAENNHIDAALQIARSIPDDGRRESALVEVAIESIPFQSPKQVLEIIANVADQSKRTRGVLALIKYLGEAGRPDEAMNYLKQLGDDPIWQDRARAFVVAAYAKAGRIAESEKVIAEIKEGFALSLATKTLASKLVRLGQIAEARGYVNSIKDGYGRCKMLAEMGGACLLVVNEDEAMVFFNEAKAIANSFDDPFKKIPLLESIARAAAENGKLDYSLQIAESMNGKGIQLIDKWEVLSLLSWKYLETGNTQKAINVAHMIRESDSRNSSFTNIASNLASKGKDTEAIEIITSQIPKGRSRDYALLVIADELAARRSFQQALKVSEIMSDPDLKIEALSSVAINQEKYMESPTLAETEILRRIVRDAKRASK